MEQEVKRLCLLQSEMLSNQRGHRQRVTSGNNKDANSHGIIPDSRKKSSEETTTAA
jgi:hypothetical protein